MNDGIALTELANRVQACSVLWLSSCCMVLASFVDECGEYDRIALGFLVLTIVITAVMGALLVCRSRIIRALKSVQLYCVELSKVRETGWVVGNQRRFHATVECSDDGKRQKGLLGFYNLSVSLAMVDRNTGKPVRIWVGPFHPKYIICLEMLSYGLDG